MKNFSKKSFALLLVVVLLIPIYGLGGLPQDVEAKGKKVKITLTGILAKDAVGVGKSRPEPSKIEQIYDLFDYGQPEDRTGYSYGIYWCNPDKEYDKDGITEKKGSGNHWNTYVQRNTEDSQGRKYNVVDYKDEIVSKYGEAIYKKAVESGKQLEYEDGSRHVIYSKDTRKSPCKLGDEAWWYDNLDFNLTMTFEYDEEEPPPLEPIEPGEVCKEYEKVISGGSAVLGATRTWEKVECKEVDGATDGITEGDIALWLYKSGDSLSQMKAKNDLHKGNVKHFEEKPELEKWSTTGNGISPRVKTAPSTYTGLNADRLKNQPVEFRHEYVYTNFYKETFRGSQTYVCNNWSSAVYDKNGNLVSPSQCTSASWSPSPIPYVSQMKEADWGKQVHHIKEYTLAVNHKRGEKTDFGEGEINKVLEVGKSAEVVKNSLTNQKTYNETLKMNERVAEKRDTQGSIEFAEHPLSYNLTSGYLENVAWHNIQKEGTYVATELDPNIRSKYPGNRIPVQFDTPQPYGNGYNVPIISSDDFYVTKNTGFLFSVPHGASPDVAVASEYESYTGANYRDSIVQAPAKFRSSYYMPIDGNGNMEPGMVYTHKTTIGKVGLSDYTIAFDKSFSFDHYLLGSIHDNPWIAEQHNPVVNVEYPHSVDISLQDGSEIKELSKERTMLLHDFRSTDGKDFYDKVRDILEN